jgi:isopenicillin N synthase-like dioxygenase
MQAKYPEISKIVEGDSISIGNLNENLKAKGWSFVVLPKTIVQQASELIQPLQSFFELPQDQKEKYQKDKLWGYNFVNHKQGKSQLEIDFQSIGLRYMTGARLNNELIPLDQRPQIEQLINDVTIVSLVLLM